MVAQAPVLELLIRGAAIGVFVLLALRIAGGVRSLSERCPDR